MLCGCRLLARPSSCDKTGLDSGPSSNRQIMQVSGADPSALNQYPGTTTAVSVVKLRALSVPTKGLEVPTNQVTNLSCS